MESIEVSKLKEIYPDEWILLGNPVRSSDLIDIIAGIPIAHGKEKYEIYDANRKKMVGFNSVKFIYTGNSKPRTRIIASVCRISNRSI